MDAVGVVCWTNLIYSICSCFSGLQGLFNAFIYFSTIKEKKIIMAQQIDDILSELYSSEQSSSLNILNEDLSIRRILADNSYIKH